MNIGDEIVRFNVVRSEIVYFRMATLDELARGLGGVFAGYRNRRCRFRQPHSQYLGTAFVAADVVECGGLWLLGRELALKIAAFQITST